MEKLEDFDSFLESVDKISQIIAHLQSPDTDIQEKAMADADCHIATSGAPGRTEVNKTTINTNPQCQPSLVQHQQTESPGYFMKIMEQDAEDRRLKRSVKAKKATALKDKGNEAYAREDFETAVKHYSDGLAELRDMQPLYTNRAQAYIKLGRYKEAISDCEWALKCNEKCIKAYLHMAKAYLGLQEYNEARKSLKKILEIEPKRETMVKEYLTQVDVAEEKENQERNAKQEFDKGAEEAVAVPQLLEKLSKPGHLTLYYCGGMEILSQALTGCTGQTLFRLHNGFTIISSNDTVRSCLLQKRNDPHSQEMCVSVLKLWRIVCCENDENQRLLMTCPVACESIVHLVTSEHIAVGNECLALLSLFSRTQRGRCLATDNLNLDMLVKNLLTCIAMSEQHQENTAGRILENLTMEKRFCIRLRNLVTDEVSLPFVKLLTDVSRPIQRVLPSLITAFSSLSLDDVIRHKLARDPEIWKAFPAAIRGRCASEQREILYPLLGLIINLSAVTSPVIQECAVSLCDCCLGLLKHRDGGIITRATGGLSNVLPQSVEAIQHAIQGGMIPIMRQLVKGTGQAATKYAIKALTVCTAASHLAREELVKSDKKLSSVRHLLGSSCDETVSGNAALCLAHCLDLEGVASHLLGTDIVPLLLRRAAGDADRTAVRQNAAIALGKLCQSEPRHLIKLRELRGLEVLHSCVRLTL